MGRSVLSGFLRLQAAALALGGGGRALPLEILDDLAPLLGTSDHGLFGDPRRNVYDNPSLPKILRLEGTDRGGPVQPKIETS
ncbi:MAG: hypothetical protein OXI87_21520 [Albidovulum sp.]|nr:hypothetical protein [Albidovulum sp.]MDE0533951.1 hypothetical protein [Albidovulum sp.]